MRVLIMTSLLVALAGCQSGPRRPKDVDVGQAWKHHKEDLAKDKEKVDQFHVYIVGPEAIVLPPTPVSAPVEARTYSYYVWVDSMGREDPVDLLQSRELQIEVLGADIASITPLYHNIDLPAPDPAEAGRGQGEGSSGLTPGSATLPVGGAESHPAKGIVRNVFELKLRSDGIPGDFEILAWRPQRFRSHQRVDPAENNPWSFLKQVKVFNGDVRTCIVMASEDEVRQLFGKEFAKYFVVGRINIQNTNSDPSQQLLVYTSTLRPKVYFYREPNPALGKAVSDLNQAQRAARAELAPTTPAGLTAGDLDNLFHQSLKSLAESPTEEDLKSAVRNAGYLDPNSASFKEATEIVRDAMAAYNWQLKQLASQLQARGVPPNAVLPDLRESIRREGRAFVAEMADETKGKWPDRVAALQTDETGELQSFLQHSAQQLEAHLDVIANELGRKYLSVTPMTFDRPLEVNLDRRPLAFSRDSERQARLSRHGYIWESYYRPMTFQAVLNSLIVSTKSSPNYRFMEWFESAGVVAGGLVGMGSVFSFVTRPEYIETVAVTTAVILPSARKLLLDDLEGHIKNLGDLAMDTVLAIPANDYVDRYIFFPKGPIFGEVDEFSISQPSFIVKVDTSDIAVRVRLVDTSVSLSKNRAVADLVSEGRSQLDAESQRRIEMLERIRRFRLSGLVAEVESLRQAGRLEEANQRLANFEAVFGTDISGVLDKLRSEVAPPQISGLPDDPNEVLPLEDPNLVPLVVTNVNRDAVVDVNIYVAPAPGTAAQGEILPVSANRLARILRITNLPPGQTATFILFLTVDSRVNGQIHTCTVRRRLTVQARE